MKNIFAGICILSIMMISFSCTTQTEDYVRAGSGGDQSQSATPSGDINNGQNANNPGINQNQQPISAQDQQQLQAQAQQQGQQNAGVPIKTIGDEKTAHFICPNACAGSGADAAANCPTCGTAYTHNTESPWHEANQQQTPQVDPNQAQTQANPNQVTTQQQSPEVILGDEKTSHYICPSSCAGSGSPAPGKCATCGTTYVHNSESPAHQAELQRQGR